jgi:hypothetical protein
MIRQISREIAKARGLKHYFTGQPCGRDHVEERFVSNGMCVQCERERRRRRVRVPARATHHP